MARTGKTRPRRLTYDLAVNREIGKAYRHAQETKVNGTDTSYRVVERVRWGSLRRKP